MYQRIALLSITVPLFLIFWTSETKTQKSTPKQRVVSSADHALDSAVRSSPARQNLPKPTSKPSYERQIQDDRPLLHNAPMRIRFYVQNEDGTTPERGFVKSDDCEHRVRYKGQHEVELYVEEECEFYAVRNDGMFLKQSDSVVIPYTPHGSVEQEFFFPTIRTGGFGISIEEDEQGIRVLHVHSDSPAEEQELKYGDVIVEIDGVSADELTVEEFIAAGTGPEGTFVSFRLLRDDPGDAPRTIVRRALTY